MIDTTTYQMIQIHRHNYNLFGRGFIGYPKGRNRDIKLVN